MGLSKRTTWRLACAWWIAVLSLGRVASAQPGDATQVERARALFESGGQHAVEGDWEQAADDYAGSLALLPRPKTRLNLATALHRLGRDVACLHHLDLFDASADPVDDHELLKLSHELRREAQSRVATIRLSVDPPPARVSLDGERVTQTGARRILYVPPGEHELRAEAAGREPQALSFPAEGGRIHEVRLHLHAASSPVATRSPAPPPRVRPVRGAWALLAAGIATLSTSLVTGVLARRADQRVVDGCAGMDPCAVEGLKAEQARAKRLGIATDVMAASGAVAAAAGLTWLVWERRRPRVDASARLDLAPGLARPGLRGRVTVRF